MNTINRYIIAGILLYFAASLFTSSAHAEPAYHSHDSIRTTIQQFLAAKSSGKYSSNAQIEVGRLDTRLKLSKCSRALTAFLPQGSKSVGNTSVGVRCEDNKPWTLYVKARISVVTNVVIAKAHLRKGDMLTKNNIQLEKKDLASLANSYMTNIGQAIGKVVKRTFKQGDLIIPSMLDKPRLVNRGTRVIVVAEIDGIQVRMKGHALGNGASGDRVKVRNLSSNKVIEGIVISANTVRVTI